MTTAKLDTSEITFELATLKFNQQEKAILLLDGFNKEDSQSKRFAIIRELFSLCVVGWDRPEPLDSWGDHLDVSEAIQLAQKALAGNTTSEEERKK
jgi:hypothetical protein